MGLIYLILCFAIGYQNDWWFGLLLLISTWLLSFLIGLMIIKMFMKNEEDSKKFTEGIDDMMFAGYVKNIILTVFLLSFINF